MDGSAFKIESLAERWDCSPQHIRKMLADGRLRGFKLGGKLWRVSAEEVARVERGETAGEAETGTRGEPANENIDPIMERVGRATAKYNAQARERRKQ